MGQASSALQMPAPGTPLASSPVSRRSTGNRYSRNSPFLAEVMLALQEDRRLAEVRQRTARRASNPRPPASPARLSQGPMSRPSFMSDDEDEEDDVAHEAAIVASSLPSAFMLPSTLVASVMTPENPLFAGDTSPALASTPEK